MAEEIKNQGQQENAENLNENVSGQAKEIISAALEVSFPDLSRHFFCL